MNSNKYLNIFLAILLLFSVTACSPRQSVSTAGEQKIKVAATIFPLYDIVREVGGNRVEPILILSPGASPHTFEVTPAQVKEVQGAKILFAIGGEVDAWAADIGNAIPGVKREELNSYLDLKPFRDAAGNGSNNHISLDAPADASAAADFDPHTWLDPDNASKMAETIALELAQADQVNKDYYLANAQDFSDALSAKDREWQSNLSGLEKKDLIVFHDAWGYFADHFGLTIAGAFEPFPGKTPSPSYLADLQKKAKEYGINTLFVEPQFSQEAVATLAKDMQAKTAVLDPLGGVKGRETYIELLDYNVNAIIQASSL